MNIGKKPTNIVGLEARQVAVKLLTAVLQTKTSLDALIDNKHGHPQYLALSSSDKMLCRAILGSSLRHNLAIETIINKITDRPLPKQAAIVKNILITGIAQLLFLRLASHATIYIMVEISKKDPRSTRFAALVNALLRKVSRNIEFYQNLASTILEAPEWFKQQLIMDYGEDKAQNILKQQLIQPTRDITVKADPAIWADKLDAIVIGPNNIRLRQPNTDITSLDGFTSGQWWVQDISSSMPIALLGEIKDKNILELCAAPGGKTAQLAHNGAIVTSIDRSKSRMSRLKENMQRLQLNVNTLVSDVEKLNYMAEFDIVILDAPCSSTGTIRRHPDILWTKEATDIEQIKAIQYNLLKKSINFVKPGGYLLFCNCSLLKAEGEELVAALLQEFAGSIKLQPFKLPNGYANLATLIDKLGQFRATPADLILEDPALSGMDGFFAALIQRIN